MITTFLDSKPVNTTITIRTCYDRGGHRYRHAFVGSYAIARRLEDVLHNEYHVRFFDGATIPDAFFRDYCLVSVERDSTDGDDGFVTSSQWYSCSSMKDVILL